MGKIGDAIGCCYGLKLLKLAAVKSMGIKQAYFGKRKSGPGYLFGIGQQYGPFPRFSRLFYPVCIQQIVCRADYASTYRPAQGFFKTEQASLRMPESQPIC